MSKIVLFSSPRPEIILALADNGMKVTEVAKKLYMHRNNVLYHVEKIRILTGKDPLNFYDLIQLVEIVRKESGNG